MKINKKKYDSDFFTRQRFVAGKILCMCMFVYIQYVYVMMYKNSKQESTKVGSLSLFHFTVPHSLFLSFSLFRFCSFFARTISILFYPPKSQQTSILSFFSSVVSTIVFPFHIYTRRTYISLSIRFTLMKLSAN